MRRLTSLAFGTLCLLGSSIAQYDPNFQENRTTIVHLFEWKWNDIAQECERFLGKAGFGGVQVSPPTENVVFNTDKIKRPWFERYQPVSYNLETRSGSETEFQDMVQRCNKTGVRIYVDVVINHMTSGWPEGTDSTGQSSFNAEEAKYDAVPFGPADFNDASSCPTTSGNIENYLDANQVRNCKLLSLNDLDQSKPHVQEVVIKYLNKLVKYGVAGFRIDAAKHMWPQHIKSILTKVDNLNTEFGFKKQARPFIYQEVIDVGSNEPITASQYTDNGRVTDFKYGLKIGTVFRKDDKAKWLRNFGTEWGLLDSSKSLAFIDNHDNQRGHGSGGANILTFRDSRLYKMANAWLLSWPVGVSRIMSSYFWEQHFVDGKDQNDWIGPPHDEFYNILDVTINDDFSCGNGWVCEHRWREIYKMVEFRNVVGGAPVVNWWDNGFNQIAFARERKGFIVFNNDDFPLIATLNTTMSPGVYCDIISGGLENRTCLGISVLVTEAGTADISISNMQQNPFLAIHEQSKMPGHQ